MSKRYKAKDRDGLVEQVRATGDSVRAVAARLGVKEGTAYLWMKQAREAKAPRFARLVTSGGSRATLTVEVGEAIIRVEPGFDSALLLDVVAALAGRSS